MFCALHSASESKATLASINNANKTQTNDKNSFEYQSLRNHLKTGIFVFLLHRLSFFCCYFVA